MSINFSDIQITVTAPDLVPTYARIGDAGADLKSAVSVSIPAGKRLLVPTGLSLALPEHLVALVHPRSGLALKHGITVLNTPGTIDSGYRGEVGVVLFNTGTEAFDIARGDRIAQLVIQEFVTASFIISDELPESERGDDGFGSTGVGAAG
jgi:dUTP pyrophosphatase